MKKQHLAMFLVICMMAALLCGCGSTKAEPEAGSTDATKTETVSTTFGVEPLENRATIRYADFIGGEVGAPFSLMDDMGWLDEVNIDFEYTYYTAGPAMMEANASWDLGSTGNPGALVGLLNYDVQAIGMGARDTIHALMVNEDSAIFKAGRGWSSDYPELYGTPETWKGTTWVLPMGTVMEQLLSKTLAVFDLTLADVTTINMDVSTAYAAFKAGEADGAGVWANIALGAISEGYCKASDVNYFGGATHGTIMATDKGISEKSDALKKVMELYYCVVDWVLDNPEAYAEWYYASVTERGVTTTEENVKYLAEHYAVERSDDLLALTVGKTHSDSVDKDVDGITDNLLMTLDFFVSVGNYTTEQRDNIVNCGRINTEFAQYVIDSRS